MERLPLGELAAAALARRAALLAAAEAEETTCYRLFHGAVEGRAGLTVDRYGPLLLVQTFREPLAPGELELLTAIFAPLAAPPLLPVWRHRGRQEAAAVEPDPAALVDTIGLELSLKHRVRARHRGQDPLMFLDLRAGRRWLLANSTGCSVLNLFAYTCGASIAAAAGGAREVWSVDFAASALAVGEDNAALNGITTHRTVQANVIPALRQLAGLSIKGRAARRRYKRLSPRRFDRVVLDPPTWSTSPFGAVDLVRDYAALLKPAALATAPGGKLLATNHVSTVDMETWLGGVQRCTDKAGRPIQDLQILTPEADFPSPDGRHPLKMVVLTL